MTTDQGTPAQLNIKKATQATEHILYEQRESLFERLSYRDEATAFNYIRDGETEKLAAFLEGISKKGIYVGNLSEDEVRQEKYIAVAFITLGARAVIQGGLPEAEAFCLNDELIQRADRLERASDVRALVYEAMLEFARRVRENRVEGNVSTAAVAACVNYIDTHLHYAVTLNDLSRVSGLSRSYLSRLFKRETGLTPTAYILKRRLNEARELLAEGRLGSSAAVANVLGFSSQSYFIACFRREFGVTPAVFMKKHR